MATVLLDLRQNALPNMPQELPSGVQADGGALVEGGGWLNAVARSIIPGYATSEDAKVTKYFLNFFKDIIAEKKCIPADQLKKIIRFAEQHIAERVSFRRGHNLTEHTKEIADLERYAFAARIRLNDFESPQQKEALRGVVQRHNQSQFAKWDRLNFDNKPADKEAFFANPDMVDFVFKQHLHRYIRHQDYMHKVEMWPVLKQREGSWVVESEAHLKMNGRPTPWSTIRKMFKVEEDTERLYTEETDGTKRYWMYLDEGFVQHDRHDFQNMRRFKQLERPPSTCKVQLITTHAPEDKWFWGDRLLQGARHTFFRIVIGEGFQRSHPDLPYRDGEVYSIGFGGPGNTVNVLQPLTTFRGRLYSPDSWEFYTEDLQVTEVDATDDKIIRLFDIVKQRATEEQGFHVIGSNCATNGMAMLREAEILDIPTKNHMITMWYEYIFSEDFRKYIDKGCDFIVRYTPESVKEVVKNIGLFIYSLVFAPLFLLLGAWRTKVAYDPETPDALNGITAEEGMVRANNRIKALFSNIYDFFDPEKMSFDLTHNVWRWQVKDAETHPERSFIIKQS
ncbi:MAG: hypothetical protein JSR39_07700 [Verrucomicrobia bacterium]|nr:hypothetical protein [Verrucomicrobiota bacterium]